MISKAFQLARMLFIIYFIFGFSHLGYGQGYTLLLNMETKPESSIEGLAAFPMQVRDSLAAHQALSLLLNQLRTQGYLESSIDHLEKKDSSFIAAFHLGPLYEWLPFNYDSLPLLIRNELDFKKQKIKKNSNSYKLISELEEQFLSIAENNGYPFAKVWTESVIDKPRKISACFKMDFGPFIQLDTLSINGDVVIDQNYLQQYLGLIPGQPYNKALLLETDQRLRDLAFLQSKESPTVRFALNKAYPLIKANKKRASRFDFIIGILPNNQQTGRLLITADLEGELYNSFGKGERIYAHFEQLRPETQELEFALQYPYLFKLPFGTDFEFNIYKRDSSFLDVEMDFGIQYLFAGGNYIKAFWRQQSSNLLAINEAQIIQQNRLPERLDLRQNLFGLALNFQKLDYRNNPRKGYALLLKAGAGTKRIRKNNQILELDLGGLYDSLELRSFQYQLNMDLAYYIPSFSRATLKIGLQSGFLFNNGPIYQNEQFRAGGNRLLRGFDEEFFFATHFAVATLEYRLLLSQNSFLFTFFDGAWLEDNSNQISKVSYPFGFGAGISLETSAGLFGISLAFGKDNSSSIDFSKPKVHFGYISLF